MSFKLLGGGSNLDSIVSDVNQNISELKNRETTEIFKDDTGTRRVLLGKGQDGFYGLKVSQEGQDVYSAADDELIFNSNQNVFKIVATDTSSVFYPASSGQAQTVIPHNLGYAPMAQVYYYEGGTNYFNTPFPVFSPAGLAIFYLDYYVNETNLVVRVTKYNVAGSTYASDSTINFRYYLLQETAS